MMRATKRSRLFDPQGAALVAMGAGFALLVLPASASRAGAGAAEPPANRALDRAQALADLRAFHLGTTITPDQRTQLESLELAPHEKDLRLIDAYRFEILGAAYWLFCAPPQESRQATELQVYLADTTTLKGRDSAAKTPEHDFDGLRGCRVVFRRFVRCMGDDKPYYLSAYGIIAYTTVPGRGEGPNRVKARLAPLAPPDNVRVRAEIDDGIFVGLPLDFDQGRLSVHEHFNEKNKPCLYGNHGQALICGRRPARLPAGIFRADAPVASAQMCSSCHPDGATSMTEGKNFLVPRERMAGYLQFPKLAQAELGASPTDLAEIRAQLLDQRNWLIPPDLPRAIEDCWVECYTHYLECKEATAHKGADEKSSSQ